MPMPDDLLEILNADPYKVFWALCIKIYLDPGALINLSRDEAIELAEAVYKKIGEGKDPTTYPTELLTEFAFHMVQWALGYGARPWVHKFDSSKGSVPRTDSRSSKG